MGGNPSTCTCFLAALPRSALSARRTALTVALWLVGGAAVHGAGTGYVFVSHEQSDTVVVLDPANDHAVVKQVATARRPRDMHFDAAHARLYVACGDDDVIDVIDVGTLEVVDQIPTGDSPEVFALTPDGMSLYVSEEETAVVRQIDLGTKQTLREISTGPEPEGVLVGTDGSTVYVTSEVADMVHVIDAASGEVTENILVGARPRRFALTADGRELWVTDELSGQVSIIDVGSNSAATTVPFLPPGFRPSDVTPVGIVLSKDGGTMFVTLGRANHVAFVDVATKEIMAYVLVGSRAWGVAQSADGKLLYVANGLSDDVTIVDIAGEKALRSIATGRVPHSIVVDD
jgi:PQQ-dependent catabolism-associated beta-propeller protein